MEPLTHLNIDINKSLLLEESKIFKKLSKGYTDSRYPGKCLEEFRVYVYTSEYSEQIMKDLGIEGSPRFYWLETNSFLPEHIDNGTQCSINIILSDGVAPITMYGQDIFYSSALLNTQIPHSVKNGDTERILFKISIFNESYEQVKNKLTLKKYVK